MEKLKEVLHETNNISTFVQDFEPTAFAEGDEEDSLYSTLSPPLPPSRRQLSYIKTTDKITTHMISRCGGRQMADLTAWRDDFVFDTARYVGFLLPPSSMDMP